MYNAPVDYVNLLLHGDVREYNLLLHGDVREYLRNVTEYRGFSIEYQYKNGKCRRLSSCGLTGVCILTDCMIAYWVRS